MGATLFTVFNNIIEPKLSITRQNNIVASSFQVGLQSISQNFCQNIPNFVPKLAKFIVNFKVHIEMHKPVF